MSTTQELNANMFLKQLQARVSVTNAKLLLDTAKVESGVKVDNDVTLETEQAKALCMKLINQGGPAFQVGQAIYKQYLM
jgi:hypothetical protein